MRKLIVPVAFLLLVGCGTGEEEEEAESMKPPPKDGQVESFDGVSIAYTVAGESEGALLFIHGWACDRGYWTGQVDAFAARQKVVTVDLPGHGDSGLDRQDWTIQSFARDIQAVVDALQLNSVVLVGHSMGGPVALDAARLMPDRVVGVIGVETFQNVESEYPDDWDDVMKAFETDFAGTCRQLVRSWFLEEADPELLTEITADICAAPPRIATALMYAFPDYDFPGALSAAGVPVRTINGSKWPTQLEINRKYAPGFDAVIIEGTGHFPMLEKPEEFNRALDRVVEELTTGVTI
jgi:pimeloyl-ACP methyl ester carboxylesterase